ncbi:MAG TPA: S8 family serine peptidase [Solirubrobacteraceae bacterium]|jgi:serine protease
MTRLRRSHCAAIAALAAAAALALLTPTLSFGAPRYAAGKIVVGYGRRPRAAAANAASTGQAPHTKVLTLRHGESVQSALTRLRRRPHVRFAVPDYVAHTTSTGFIPDDPGRGETPEGWKDLQWNFDSEYGVEAPEAWEHLIADGAPGGEGVVVAVLDTGVAYESRGRFLRSPDFEANQFVKGYDFVAKNTHPDDRNGHGTFVAGTIAEATNNGIALTGLAYGVKIMPVRVLDARGEGDATTISQGVRFAVNHGAQVINLSLEFSGSVTASEVPELTSALAYAHSHGVVVVAAAGNESSTDIPYPARDPFAIAVGATTEDGCLAEYSNYGPHINIVAPGGGSDARLRGDSDCKPYGPAGRDIYQETFLGSSPKIFGLPGGYEGTSMASPDVAATAALVIASGLLGPKPTPAAVRYRIEATARPLGGPKDAIDYGHGLVDAATATAPGGPGAVSTTSASTQQNGASG